MQDREQRQLGDSTKQVPQQEQGVPSVKRSGGLPQWGGSDDDAQRVHDEAARDAVSERDLNFDEDEEATKLGDKAGF